MSFQAWLQKAKDGLADGVARFKNRDFMDACMAGCAMVAAADGSIDSDEKQKMVGFINMNDALKCFDQKTCTDRFTEFAGQFEFDHGVGSEAALKAIAKLTGMEDQARMLVRVCCAIGSADGVFDNDEKNVVRKICQTLGLRSAEFEL